MGFFGLKKKGGVIDLGKRYREQQEKIAQIKASAQEEEPKTPPETQTNSSPGFFNFFGNTNSSAPLADSAESEDEDPREKRRRLAKRLKDMTDKIEDLSNQIYRLQQRIEVLEKKSGVNAY